ncbi:MAG: GspE/PulE family protein, partial [Kiloniellales bacterium]
MSRDVTDILRGWGKLDDRGLTRAQGLKEASGEPLHVILCRLGLVGEADMARALAASLELPMADESSYPAEPVLADRVATSFLRASRVLPLADGAEAVAVAMADPLDQYAVEALQLLLEKPVQRWVAVPAELDRHIERLYGDGEAMTAAAIGSLAGDVIDAADLERLKDMASEVPVVRLVNRIIADAVAARASDIHIEPYQGELKLRHRVDGVLRPVKAPPTALHAGIVSRIKIMAALNIVERRLPQDGRCKVNVQGREIDIRVSCMPTMHGEGVVLRVLDKASAPLKLDRLGFAEDCLGRLRDLLERARGILLVTGPTGSGKTTTLYAALQQLNTTERKIVTVEDPIEYQLPGINQIQVKPRIGLGFANVLRSVLRHDPDVIMVGEIRDLETAQIAVQASLTGHLVLSTLHTNSAASAVTRLADMGVEPYL